MYDIYIDDYFICAASRLENAIDMAMRVARDNHGRDIAIRDGSVTINIKIAIKEV